MRQKLHVFALAVALILRCTAYAELRKPTPAEQQVLNKYVTVINKVLDQFQSDDWNESVDYSVDDEVQVHPNSGRPLDVDEMFQRSYNVRPGSDRFKRLVQPVIEKLQHEPDPSKKAEITKGVQDLMRLRVEVHFNRESIGFDPPPAANTDLHLEGTAFAYKVNENPDGHGESYLLAFGSWGQLNWDAQHRWYHFRFAHPQNTPYIENIEIRIYGAPDRIQELLHTVDWKQVNEALAR